MITVSPEDSEIAQSALNNALQAFVRMEKKSLQLSCRGEGISISCNIDTESSNSSMRVLVDVAPPISDKEELLRVTELIQQIVSGVLSQNSFCIFKTSDEGQSE